MKDTYVQQWMARDIISADPHMRLHDALRLVNKHQNSLSASNGRR